MVGSDISANESSAYAVCNPAARQTYSFTWGAPRFATIARSSHPTGSRRVALQQHARAVDCRFDTSLVYGDSRGDPAHQYTHEHMWPAGSAYPNYFILGDPHLNYYEGSATVSDIRLYVPAE